MFHNTLDTRVYIQEVCDKATGKHYNVHIKSCIPQNGPLKGLVCNDVYITTPDPHCDVLVGIGHKAFAPDEFDTVEDMTAALDEFAAELLPDGIKRFEAIMATGIAGNEMNW